MILILILKGNTGTHGIGLIETVWKVVHNIIDTRLKACITFQIVFHGFQAKRRTGMTIIEIKLAQELASIDQDPLFLVLIDL